MRRDQTIPATYDRSETLFAFVEHVIVGSLAGRAFLFMIRKSIMSQHLVEKNISEGQPAGIRVDLCKQNKKVSKQ